MTLRKLLALSTIVLLSLLVGCAGGGEPEPDESEQPDTSAMITVDPATAGAINGKVTFTGSKAPRVPSIKMDAEPTCAKAHGGSVKAQNFAADSQGGILNAFVYIKKDFDGKFPVPGETVMVDQKDCVYTPHVVGAMAGQKVSFTNSDPVSHNVNIAAKNNRQANHAQAPGSGAIEKTFARPEILITVKCNVHPWMRTYVGILKHPYFAVTSADGSFSIPNLPPGDYTLAVWQEALGEKEIQITVGESETVEANVEYNGKE